MGQVECVGPEEFRAVLGRRIREARMALRMRQQDLAKRAGFAHLQTISDIERGARDVHVHELVRIASVLGLHPIELLSGRSPAPAPVQWRAEPDPAVKARAEADFLRYCRDYRWLEELLGCIPEVQLPRYRPRGRPTLSWANRLGEEVAERLGLGPRPADRLQRVLEEDYGVKLRYADEAGSGACTVGDFGYGIMLNRREAPWRRNFSLAHELFHLVTWDTVGGDEAEPLANAFAASLLLPAARIRPEVERLVESASGDVRRVHRADLIGLARSYGVSTEALLWRLVSLGYLAHDDVRDMLTDPWLRGLDRTARRTDWYGAPVRSERFTRLAVLAHLRGIISRTRLAELLEVPLAELPGEFARLGFPESVDDYGRLEPDAECAPH